MAKKTKPIVFDFDSVDEVHDEVLEASPEANQEAIDAHAEAELETLREQTSNADKDGTIFNPELHALNKDGEPSLTPTGKFRKKRGTGSKVAAKSEAAQTVQDEVAARAAGQLAADILVGSAVTLLGEEWIPVGLDGEQEPMKFDEHSNLRRAFGDYFVAKNYTDFPSGIMLSIAVSSYAGARLAGGEETKSRLSKAWAWTKETTARIFRRKKSQNGSNKDAPHDNTRDNGVRKNDVSEVSVQSEQEQRERHPST